MIEYLFVAVVFYMFAGAVLHFFGKKGDGLIWAAKCWYVGATYDPVERALFIFPLPFIGIVVKL